MRISKYLCSGAMYLQEIGYPWHKESYLSPSYKTSRNLHGGNALVGDIRFGTCKACNKKHYNVFPPFTE